MIMKNVEYKMPAIVDKRKQSRLG